MGRFIISYISVLFIFLHIHRNAAMEIIGGNVAAPHSRPYMALITNSQICGGTLIKQNWVLTAAHCKISPNNSEVILGAHFWKKEEKQQQKFKVVRSIPHPCFDYPTKINDIQLIQLNRPAKIDRYVSILPLPTTDKDIKAGSSCSTAGWGVTKPNDKKSSDVLREANLTIVDRGTCNKIYKKYKHSAEITTNMLCAGAGKKKNDDSCKGDSGGPLICNKKYSGIVSFGLGCGKGKIPGVYTRLNTKYLKWIKDTIGGA